jgi:ABC-type transporter Mla subunit MlaD
MPRGEFVAAANAICEDSTEALNDLAANLDPSSPPSDFVERTAGELEDLLQRLDDLEAPSELQDRFATLLDSLDQGIAELRPLADAVEKSLNELDPQNSEPSQQNIEAVREISTRLNESLATADKAALDLGLDECAGAAGASDGS